MAIKKMTRGGAVAVNITPEQALRRSVMACLLWEDSFYEEGESIVDRIRALVTQLPPKTVADIAIEAREKMGLRHVPLLLVREMARQKGNTLVASTLARVIKRVDEITEFVSVYWKDNNGGKKMLPRQVKLGLSLAFNKFDEYQFGKYNRDSKVKLRDVLFLCHAKPAGQTQADLFLKITEDTLKTPDTWEVALSGGADPKTTWERLLQDNKLGAMALIRNLRGMEEKGVTQSLIRKALSTMKVQGIFPWQFVTAYLNSPKTFAKDIEAAMLRGVGGIPKLPGKTIIIQDISGSMNRQLSRRGSMNRLQAASAMTMLLQEVCEESAVYATAGDDYKHEHKTCKITARGFNMLNEMTDARNKIGSGGIFLVQVMNYVKKLEGTADRIIVITDEQDCDDKLQPDKADVFGRTNYLMNVSCEQNGIGYGKWTHIDGFSTACIEYLRAAETQRLFTALDEEQEMKEAVV